MTDIVDRLRDQSRFASESEEQARLRRYKERLEGADEIIRLRAEIDRLQRLVAAQ